MQAPAIDVCAVNGRGRRPEVDCRGLETASHGFVCRFFRPAKIPRFFGCWALSAAVVLLGGPATAEGYDPLAVLEQGISPPLDLSVKDEARRRVVPLRIYLPRAKQAAPVVLFSHGLGGTCEGSAYLGRHWAARGYAVVHLQHPGSDDSVWRNVPAADRLAAMRKAANAENFLLRVRDVPAVLDVLERWNVSENNRLAGRLDMTRVGMSGHSFGAVTTQAIAGQGFRRGEALFADPRIKAAVVLSPSSPRHGGDPKQAFGGVKTPWLLMTGTKDVAVIGDADVESRLAVFSALPPGGKYQVILNGAEHSAFSDRALPGDTERRNPNHHRVVLALSTAFWDAWLSGDRKARAWLDGEGPSTVLEPKDRWEKK